ncbi:MAG: GNAT family N-acetyltransferase [Bacteroidota bacterium]
MYTPTETVFAPLTKETVPAYIEVGAQSYTEHYLHLWENQDPTPYLETSFIVKVVIRELNDPHCYQYLLKFQEEYVGVLKIVTHQGWGNWAAEDTIYLHRLYLLKNATGKNIGKAVLDFTQNFGHSLQKKIIWLEAMKKGKAKNFYQKNGYAIIGESNVELSGALAEQKAMWVMAKPI